MGKWKRAASEKGAALFKSSDCRRSEPCLETYADFVIDGPVSPVFEIAPDVLVFRIHPHLRGDGITEPEAGLQQAFGIQAGEDPRSVIDFAGKSDSAQRRRGEIQMAPDAESQNILLVVRAASLKQAAYTEREPRNIARLTDKHQPG